MIVQMNVRDTQHNGLMREREREIRGAEAGFGEARHLA